jgi:uncharacterized protein
MISLRAAVLLGAAALSPRVAPAQKAGAATTGVARVVPPSPAPNGFIHDGPGVIAPPAEQALNARIAAVQARTGGDIAVAIIADLRGYAPVDAGVAIYRAWKVGKVDSLGSARRDLGALLLIVPKELAPDHRGECWITTGRGAEGTLLDSQAGAICRDRIVPALKVRDYAAAVDSGIAGIAAAFDRATGVEDSSATGVEAESSAAGDAMSLQSSPPEEDHRGFPWVWAAGVGLAAAAAGAGVSGWKRYQRNKPRLCPAGHGPMTRLDEATDDSALAPSQQAEERVGSVDYDVWACAACPERIVIGYRRWSRYTGCPKCNARTLATTTKTITHATQHSTGLEETTLDCAFCGYHDVTRRVTPVLPPPSSSSSSSGGGSSGGSSFGGSGSSSGGGGGSSY